MPTVGDVASRFGEAYVARHGAAMLPSHRRALHDLSVCGTAALGGHVSGCDHCGYEHFVYHSCRNRSCPQCHGAATAAWTAARIGELLPVPYFHVVFTVPSELREVIRAHQRLALGLLMSTAAESLQALAADPHYVGGTLGILVSDDQTVVRETEIPPRGAAVQEVHASSPAIGNEVHFAPGHALRH